MAVTFMRRVGAAFRPRISSSVGQRSAAGEGGVLVALALSAASAASLPLAFAFAGVATFALPFAPAAAVGLGLALCFAVLGGDLLLRWLPEVFAGGEAAAGDRAEGANATSVLSKPSSSHMKDTAALSTSAHFSPTAHPLVVT